MSFFEVTTEFKKGSLKKARQFKTTTEPVYFSINGQQYIIPVGFEWDGATGAGWLTRFLVGLNRFGGMDRATCIHDWIYESEGKFSQGNITRKQADGLFKNELYKAGYEGFRLNAIYRSVRFFGFFYWPQL